MVELTTHPLVFGFKATMAETGFKLDLDEKFQHLSHAPIVEAVIHWQARAQQPFEPDAVQAELSIKLADYQSEQLHRVHLEAKVSGQGDAPVVQHEKDWHGFRLSSADKLHIVQFTRDGVAFSRLQPYQDWDHFAASAKSAWRAFVEIAVPLEIQRLGVRFINHIPVAAPEILRDVLRDPPTCPSNLPLNDFVYQSTFSVPDQPFGIRVIKVMQPQQMGQPLSSGLLLDCDVYTTKPITCEELAVDEALTKMRWLKNKIFFALLTESAVQSFL
jgi:uncharacterized protein (TIGR04255 family)